MCCSSENAAVISALRWQGAFFLMAIDISNHDYFFGAHMNFCMTRRPMTEVDVQRKTAATRIAVLQ